MNKNFITFFDTIESIEGKLSENLEYLDKLFYQKKNNYLLYIKHLSLIKNSLYKIEKNLSDPTYCYIFNILLGSFIEIILQVFLIVFNQDFQVSKIKYNKLKDKNDAQDLKLVELINFFINEDILSKNDKNILTDIRKTRNFVHIISSNELDLNNLNVKNIENKIKELKTILEKIENRLPTPENEYDYY